MRCFVLFLLFSLFVTLPVSADYPFSRGDANADGDINIADAVFLLNYLFAGGEIPPCLDAVDANDDGKLSIADAVKVLYSLFGGIGPLPEPSSGCGIDPTLDELDCQEFPPCKEYTVPDIEMQFVYVEPGTFMMGSDAHEAYNLARPVHEVTLTKGFYIGKYEVTNGQILEYLRATGDQSGIDLDAEYCPIDRAGDGYELSGTKFGQSLDQPMVEISWNGAVAFCQWLTERERAAGQITGECEYRLPTEAEWEYAARGGNQSKGYKYSGSDNIDEVAWYEVNSEGHTHKVGGKKQNEIGIYDMSGNAWEWCADFWFSAYYEISPPTDPTGPETGTDRMFRGGGWSVRAGYCECAYRYRFIPVVTDEHLSFRVVLAPGQ